MPKKSSKFDPELSYSRDLLRLRPREIYTDSHAGENKRD
jgi:hypothetical protein